MAQHGVLMHISEVLADLPGLAASGQSVRVLGTLDHVDATEARARISYHGSSLDVDTSMIPWLHLDLRSWYQFIGEVKSPEGGTGAHLLLVRVGRNVNGIDSQLYDEALELRRKFIESLEQAMPL
mmetsp:Transcript_36634/g.103412  ORF Transcript_36634/g.103412 Transcript_36634/m.103412 type:complete len:125 (-) Transcript_36634:614-988(-)